MREHDLDASDLLGVMRSFPESGRLAPLSLPRLQKGAQRLVACLKVAGFDAPEGAVLRQMVQVLHDGATSELPPDAVRLAIWLAYRALLAQGKAAHARPQALRGLAHAWNAVSTTPEHTVRMGRSSTPGPTRGTSGRLLRHRRRGA